MSRIDKIRQRSDAKRNGRDTVIHPSIHPSISCHSNLSCLVLLQFVAQFDFDGLLCFISLLTDSIVSGFYVSLSMRTPTTHTHAHTRTRTQLYAVSTCQRRWVALLTLLTRCASAWTGRNYFVAKLN